MDPRIGDVRPLYGPRPVTDRRDRRQSGTGGEAFEEALEERDEDRAPEPRGEEPAARPLQNRPRIVRRQDDDGIVHVDILA